MPEENTVDIQQQKRTRALLRAALRGAIAQASDRQAEASQHRLLAERLTKTNLDKTQIRNLETLAYTTDKVSDITDLLKKLVGRDTRKRRWAKGNVGADVIVALQALRPQADKIVANIPGRFREALDADLPRRVHLELCREFVKHLAAEFIYQKQEA